MADSMRVGQLNCLRHRLKAKAVAASANHRPPSTVSQTAGQSCSCTS